MTSILSPLWLGCQVSTCPYVAGVVPGMLGNYGAYRYPANKPAKKRLQSPAGQMSSRASPPPTTENLARIGKAWGRCIFGGKL